MNYSTEAQFDKQGKYFWNLVKKANWTSEQVQSLLIKKYNKTHFNILDDLEKRQVIGIMKNYEKKHAEFKLRKQRQRIMAIWGSSGRDLDDLHAYMNSWGYKPSLREQNAIDLANIEKFVRVVCGVDDRG